MNNKYDILIIGGGVAGMTAAIYAKRANKNVAIIENVMLGGQVTNISNVENFPSYASISGFDMVMNFTKQLKSLQIPVISDEISSVVLKDKVKTLVGKKNKYLSDKVIIASGMSYKKIGVNEDEFLGRGVSYCVVCDADFFKGKIVCVASFKGSGIKAALQLSDICKKVILLDMGDLTKYASVCPKKNIQVVSFAKILKLKGKQNLESVDVEIEGEIKEVETQGLFVELGKMPSSKLFQGQLKIDDNGFIETNQNMETSQSGVYACGDVRNGVLKQIVTACNDGAVAGQMASI